MRKLPSLSELGDLNSDDVVLLAFRTLPMCVEKDEKTGEWRVSEDRSEQGSVLPPLLHFTKPEAREKGYGFKVTFVGLPGVHTDDPVDRRKITELLAQHSCVPVWVDKEVAHQHLHFSIDFLWPVFHNQKIFADHSAGSCFDELQWKSFQSLNNAYAEVIEAKGSPDALVWVHDYPLLLVPRYLYLRRPNWQVSFFLHSAFPGTEVLSCLPNREEILQSMLSSRLVTFQIFDYMRNFISCCSVILGAGHSFQAGGILQVEHESRCIAVTTDHFVLSYQSLERSIQREEVRISKDSFRARFKGKTIIGSYDKCDRFAGLPLKLREFHKFLSDYLGHRDKVVLVQYLTPVTEHGVEDISSLIRDLEAMAAETNQAFQRPGEPPVVSIIVEDLDADERLALMQATDVLFDTSINDGLNLMPFLFYAAHAEDKRGVVILSEFCGCSRVLTGAFKINPWSSSAVMVALDQALNVEASEQAARFVRDHSYVASQTVVQWVSMNLNELKSTSRQGGGGQSQVATYLDFDRVIDDYRNAKTRVIFMDNEGTIAAKAGWFIEAEEGAMTAMKRQGTPPDEQVLHCLRSLANDRGNTVVVLSGREPEVMDRWFGEVPGLGLCAEHGFYWVQPRSLQPRAAEGDAPRQWCSMGDNAKEDDDEWKPIVFELMKHYVKRVQGSIVECKSSAMVWNYEGVGAPMLTKQMARELARFLDPDDSRGVMHGYPVKVVSGRGYVEVKRRDVDKGVAVTRILTELQRTLPQPIEFVLCIGDDRSDEDMFEAVGKLFQASASSSPVSPVVPDKQARQRLRRGSKDITNAPTVRLTDVRSRGSRSSLSPADSSPTSRSDGEPTSKCHTVTVGRKDTKARFFVKDVDEVSVLLTKLSAQSVISSFQRFSSLPTLLQEEDDGSSEGEELPAEERPRDFMMSRTTTARM